jgi:pimeloyl-ACP methyl ester carboxylesterase
MDDLQQHDARVTIPSGSLACTIAGSGEPILLVHGLGGSRRTWRHVIMPLSLTHTVIAVDLPGHGDSAAPAGDYSLGAHAVALRDLLMMLGHQKATVIGHSLGGGIAMQFAYQFPERLSRLALISSGGLGTELSLVLRAATLPGASAVVAGLTSLPSGLRVLVQPALSVVPGLVAHEDAGPLADAMRSLSIPRQRAAFFATARAVIDWKGQKVSAERQLAMLNDLPVLVAWGADDKIIPPRHHQALVERLPGCHAVEIEGAGHFPHETAASALVPSLYSFMTSTTPFVYDEEYWRQRQLSLSSATAEQASAAQAVVEPGELGA